MGLFDRFTSRKGKEAASKPKAGKIQADEAQQKTFASVPSGKDQAPVEKKSGSAKDSAKTPAKTMTAKESTYRADRVLVRPVVTEKSSTGQAGSQYTFMIAPEATKVDVRQAVFHVYGVMPVSINIVNLPGKWVRYGRAMGQTAGRKKAIVTLPAGKTIDTAS